MAAKERYMMFVSMDVQADKEDLFNEVYDTEHVPYLMEVPGVISVTRAKQMPLVLNLAGGPQEMDPGNEPTYMAIYEVESPDVMKSEAWGEAGERGRWATEVRPYTTNRRHILRKVMD